MNWIFGRRRRERDLDEEIRSHFRMAVEERVARGEPRQDAERAVRREFGNEARVREVTRTMWGGMWLDRLAQDVRYGLRSLRRDPGFAMAAAVILTVGIGANAIVFTLAKRVLFDAPPAVTDADELVAVTWTREDGRETVWGHPDYAFVRDESTAFSDVLAYMPGALPTAAASTQGASQADAWVVSANFFDVLGSPMALGRSFLPEEGRTLGTHPVVVLSHGFWERYFGADPSVLGRSLSLNGAPFTVVGVAHRDFRGVSPVETPPDIYVPLMMMGTIRAGSGDWFERVDGDVVTWLRLVARLRDGSSLEAAQANMESLKLVWDEQFAGWVEATGVGPFRMGVRPDYRFAASDAEELRRMLGFLAVVVAAVLLIACMNVALLLLARAPAREGELSVRSALGAGRGRIVRQLLTEGILLASLGGIGGLLIAHLGSPFVARLMPYSFAADFTPDASVLAYAGVVVVVVAAMFGLAPALRFSGSNIGELLRADARTTRHAGARNLLVVGQVAAAVVLVAGAGLFVRSLQAARSVDLGFDPDNRLVLSVSLDNHGYDETSGRGFLDEVLERTRALPGVEAAAVTTRPPFSGRWSSSVVPEDTEAGPSGVGLNFNRAGPAYFDVMGTTIVNGRAIDEDDTSSAPPVLMVNETTAERLWPREIAVGKTIEWRDRVWTIVGVAADAKYYTIGEEPASQVYVSHAQDYDGEATFIVRTSIPPTEVAPAIQAIIREIDGGVAVFDVRTLRELVDGQMSTYRALAILVGTFGIIALLMAALGLYGVLAYLVGQSSREIGIRMALGARATEVASAVVRRGATMAGLGIAIGLVSAWGLAGLLRQMLFGVEPQDPVTLGVVAAVLLAATLLASWLPARRAARVDPVVALREA
ncbi:MAG TPA: ABC transporter permease [Longimicrobiales bacterium]|nr:ABC transporter permease [Longimicrobiales bacterium]